MKKIIIFRVPGIPLPNPKENNNRDHVYHRDKPIILRHPVTGRRIEANENLVNISWPFGMLPKVRTKGKYLMQQKPRAHWSYYVRRTAEEFMQRHEYKPFEKNVPLVYASVFYLPRPAKPKSIFPSGGDQYNFDYIIWNALKYQPTNV